ncbi:MAG: MotA/TolQ/ExbB proton channel family protein [Leptospirillia bacterium]
MSGSTLDLILSAGWTVKLALFTLIGFSIATWAVILFKWKSRRALKGDNAAFMTAYARADDLQTLVDTPNLPSARGFGFVLADGMEKVRRHGNQPYTSDWLSSLERRLRGTIREEVTSQEQYLAVLATTANVAPFIGLFGTVVGIIDAFREIAMKGSASIAAVAPGVAEALVATAAGLFAAIPAVVAFNYFINGVRSQAAQMETFSIELVDLVQETGPGAVRQ